jgi:hypothetical protein
MCQVRSPKTEPIDNHRIAATVEIAVFRSAAPPGAADRAAYRHWSLQGRGMNAVEIEEAVSALAADPFDPEEFPFAFLTAFGTKETTIKRLRVGGNNQSDVPGGVLLRGNIHLAACAKGAVDATLKALSASPKTASTKAKFVLATDGVDLEAEEIASGETVACAYGDLAEHFGFFLPLAGISTVREIKNNPIDIKATGRLNKLYIELLKENPEWGADERRRELNQLMARLIFCFFAEDTGIFPPDLFTKTVSELTDAASANTHIVIAELFRAMDIEREKRAPANVKSWADKFPYVNGGLFTDATECPRFSRIARAYLLRAGELNWREINPDIFGSMIQAVEDEGERGSLGMHYTSVPNILKVLNPLFLDDLRQQLEAAGDNSRKLRNLRRRIAAIRVFDPACGSGNFLVVAYQQMREIEAEIARRLDEDGASWIKLENFYGIEIKGFPVEIAKLSLLIAEFQCDVRYRGERLACLNVLPLHHTGQIHVGNALRMNWLDLCPPTSKIVAKQWDLGGPTGRLPFEENGVDGRAEPETYICGNPPYAGKGKKSDAHLDDMKLVLSNRMAQWGYVDYVGCWFMLASDYCKITQAAAAFVATNSICQGRQLPQLWPTVLAGGIEIGFAYRSFKWSNNAKNNAGVICAIVCIRANVNNREKQIFDDSTVRVVNNINAYLISGCSIYIDSRSTNITENFPLMLTGSVPNDGGNFLFSSKEKSVFIKDNPYFADMFYQYLGAEDFIHNNYRFCLEIEDGRLSSSLNNKEIARRLNAVRELREKSPKKETREILASQPHRFQHRAKKATNHIIIVPRVSSESRQFLPVGLIKKDSIVSDQAFMFPDAPIWTLALIASRLHLVWVATVCGKLKADYRYSNTLGWNTFPVPPLTEKNKADLNRCAEDILLARENHFPKTIAELYDPEEMPDDLRCAHEANDETLERIYIGRRFKNDTERLERLFDLYTKMTAAQADKEPKAKATTKTSAKATRKSKAVS